MTKTKTKLNLERPQFKQYSELKGLSLLKGILEFSRNPLEFTLKCAAEYGDIVSLSIGSNKTYLLNNPSLIEEVLNKQNQNWIKDLSYRTLKNVFGDGLLLSHGDSWKHHRRLMQSGFNGDRFTNYGTQVVKNTDEILKQWRSDQVYDIHQEMSLLTVKVIMQAMFGVDGCATATEIITAMNTILLQYSHQAETLYLLPNWLPTVENWQAYRARARLKKIVAAIVEERRLLPQDDLLSIMLSARDDSGNKLSSQELSDEVMTLLLAGYDTTANTLSWTLMCLAQNPQVEQKLMAEVTSVLGTRLPTRDDIPNLTYTQQVLKESLRLYPPAWILGRELIEDCTVGDHHFSRGTVLYFSQWAVHRDARFFEDPEQFNPGRWTDNFEQRLPRCAYFPFGAGARICIGKAFSMMEMTLILALVMQKYSFSLLPNQQIELMPSFTLRPKSGIKMMIAQRK